MNKPTIFIGTNSESNYVRKLLDKVPADWAPGASIVDILHDDWCGILNGGDRCNCDPEIRISKVD